jgi:hypothetical protein
MKEGWKEKGGGVFEFFTAKFPVANLLDKTTPQRERHLLLFNWKDRSALSTRRKTKTFD